MSEPKYQEGQVVKIKSYEELKADEYHLLYTDDKLQTVAGAEVAIYKVISDQRAITWYQVGQLGRNLIDIPEAYIKCEVCLDKKTAEPMPEESASQKNFYEFSNQVRAAVCNDEYQYSDMEALLKECLVLLHGKMYKGEEVIASCKINDLFQRLISKFHERILSSPRKEEATLKPGMLCYATDGAYTGKIDLTSHLSSILNEIERFSNAKEDKSVSHFKRVKEWFEKHYQMESLWMFANYYKSFGPEHCCKSLKSCLGSLKLSIYSDNTDGVLENLVSLLSTAVMFVVITENFNSTENSELKKAFYGVTERMLDLYCRKNKDYGDSFAKSLDEDGLLVAKIRIGDKVNRYSTLMKNKVDAQVKEETLVDTLIDMANYTIMTIMWIEDKTGKSLKSN